MPLQNVLELRPNRIMSPFILCLATGFKLHQKGFAYHLCSAAGRNSLECGGPAPLWSEVIERYFRIHQSVPFRFEQPNSKFVTAQGWAKAPPGRRTPRRTIYWLLSAASATSCR